MDTCESMVEDVNNVDEVDGIWIREPVQINVELRKGIDDVEHEGEEKTDDSIKPKSKCPLFSEKSLEAIEDMIVQDLSEVQLYNYGDAETVKRKTTAVNEDLIVKRISAKEESERTSGSVKSQIFVKHELEDTPKGDPLGGFLETVLLTDGCEAMLHSFCNIDKNGILYQHLQIRDGQYLLSLNGQELSGLTSVDHEEVMCMLRTLPIDKENTMMVFDPKKKQTKNIKFVFSGIKEHIVKTVFVPLEQPLFQQWRKTEIVAIKLTNIPLFLTCGKDGKLQVTPSTDWRSNHCCHFEHWNKLVFDGIPECLSVYKHEQTDVFLGCNGNVVELVNGKFQHLNVQFVTNMWNSSFIIRPVSKRGMVLCYDGSSALKVVSENENLGIQFQKPKVNCK